RTWSFLLGLGQEVAGTLSGNFRVSGTHDRPALKGTCDLKGGRVSGVGFDRLSGEVDLADGQIAANLEVLQRPGRSAAVKGSLPTSLVLGGGDSPSEKPVELFLESQGLDVGFLAVLLDEVHSASGTLSARIRLNGRPGELRPEGWFRLDQGSAHIGPLNKTFAPINAHVRLAPDRIEVESLRVGSAENTLRLEGVATLSGPAVGEIHAHVRAGHFGVIDLPELTAIATADVSLGGSLEDPRVEGTVQLERAVVRLSDYLEAPPETQSVWEGSAFLRSLMGTVRVSASRNVWIRDRDLNVEISGDVDLVKTTDGIRIYGSLASRRGRYDFQNTSFDIDQGEIHFRGQAEIDPELYILATQRIMLASGEPATISAIVGGTLLYPRITLESDTTPPLSEADMLSYLVLGRPSENVIGGAQESGSGKPGIEGQAAGLVLGVAANQLKRQIGRQLNLDLVEIDMGGGGGTTRVRVGKYIGTKLFVSYAQDVSSARAQEVTVEYELLPQVTLEAQQRSGSQTQIDRKSLGVFWKLEW
ncbi:MAG: translocation/assembly module TamB domain-containing protein, partial [Candidatus Latescibacteria bacterium]|nr:translocation/assembly module TamB domain-containing protein [Candidatus Latescibacterota bacterium]